MLFHVMHKLFLLASMACLLIVAIILMLCCSTLAQADLIPHNCRNHDNSTVEIREAVSALRSSTSVWLRGWLHDWSLMKSLTQPDSLLRVNSHRTMKSSEAKHMLPVSVTGQKERARRVFPLLYPGDCLFWGVNNLRCCLRSKLENEWILILWIKTKTPSCSCRMSYNSRSFGYLHCKEWEATIALLKSNFYLI